MEVPSLTHVRICTYMASTPDHRRLYSSTCCPSYSLKSVMQPHTTPLVMQPWWTAHKSQGGCSLCLVLAAFFFTKLSKSQMHDAPGTESRYIVHALSDCGDCVDCSIADVIARSSFRCWSGYDLIASLVPQNFHSARTMNIFRFAGDMTHLLSIVVLLLKIHATRSCRGTCRHWLLRSAGPLETAVHDHRDFPENARDVWSCLSHKIHRYILQIHLLVSWYLGWPKLAAGLELDNLKLFSDTIQ